MCDVLPQQYSLDASSWGEGLKCIVKSFIRPAEIQKKTKTTPNTRQLCWWIHSSHLMTQKLAAASSKQEAKTQVRESNSLFNIVVPDDQSA